VIKCTLNNEAKKILNGAYLNLVCPSLDRINVDRVSSKKGLKGLEILELLGKSIGGCIYIKNVEISHQSGMKWSTN